MGKDLGGADRPAGRALAEAVAELRDFQQRDARTAAGRLHTAARLPGPSTRPRARHGRPGSPRWTLYLTLTGSYRIPRTLMEYL